MKRLISAAKSAAKWRQYLALFLAAVFVLSACMSGTYAFADTSQHRTNAAQGEGNPMPENALLQKYEMGADGKPTTVPVPGAHFSLFRVHADGTQERLDSFITGKDGQIQAQALAPGNYYWQETYAPYGFAPELDEKTGQPKQYHFSVPSQDGKPITVIAYDIRKLADLSVTKTVEGEGADLAKEFVFTAVIGGKTETFTLRHGETKVFKDIPVGTQYEITEAPAAGYTVTSENHTGNVPESGVTVRFTNTHQPQYGTIIVTKTVTGEGADPNARFTFTAVIGLQTETFTLGHGESKTFSNIPVGTSYTVTESSTEHYTPLNREFKGTVQLGDVVITLPFVNHYQPPVPPGQLEIRKTIAGDAPDTQQLFTFEITFTGEGAPQSPQTFTLRHGESKLFKNLPQGTSYTVTETDTGGYYADFTAASGIIASGEKAVVTFINRMPQQYWITVTKRVEGNPPESDKDKQFSFTLTIDGQAHRFTLKAGETSQRYTIKPGSVYSLAEEDYSGDGYIQSGSQNTSGTAGNSNIEIVRVNTYKGPETIDIPAEKRWDLTGAPAGTILPEQVTIYLMNGSVIVAEAQLKPDGSGNWKHTFTGLPKYDALGKEIVYTLAEARIPGWTYTTDGFIITNKWQAPVVPDAIEVEKRLEGVPSADAQFTFLLTPVSGPASGIPMPKNDTITISGAGKVSFGSITYTAAGTYVYTITEQTGNQSGWVYDLSVYTLTVTVQEDSSGKLTAASVLKKGGESAGHAVFINRYSTASETIHVRVTKLWKGDDENRPASVQVQLYKDGAAFGNPSLLSDANGWTRTWEQLDARSIWTVKELDVPEGYTAIITGDQINGYVITNTKDADKTTSVKVTKVWSGEDAKRPESVAVQLYKDGEAHLLPVTLSEENKWTYTWNGLDEGPKWTVNEPNVPDGYSKSIVGDAANGFVITNTKKDTPPPSDEEVVIKGKKTWNHGACPAAQRPEAITVIIKADDAIVTQRRITAQEHWSWAFRLPKYSSEGKEIVYTVDEARFEDYSKTIDGYNIINTYNPGSDTEDPTPKPPEPQPPKTDDENKLTFWLTLMVLSFVILAALLIPWNKLRRKGRQGQ